MKLNGFKLKGSIMTEQNISIILRKLIGLSAILLPIGCIMGGLLFNGSQIEMSISSYYYTNMQDWFVGILVWTGISLIVYKGYDIRDNISTSLAGIFGICIAIFPTTSYSQVSIFNISGEITGVIHGIFASLFFILLAVISIFLFTKGNPNPTKEKKKRNIIYYVCGGVIIFGILGIAITLFIPELKESITILILETLMLFAFSISWFIKGEIIFKDKL